MATSTISTFLCPFRYIDLYLDLVYSGVLAPPTFPPDLCLPFTSHCASQTLTVLGYYSAWSEDNWAAALDTAADLTHCNTPNCASPAQRKGCDQQYSPYTGYTHDT